MPTHVIIKYVMKARLNTPPYQLITWSVYNTPDMTGTFSGYLGQIETDTIAIDYTVELNQAIENATPVYILPTGPATGDLGGNYPNPIVVGLQGNPVLSTPPVTGQVLGWDGAEWLPITPPASLPPNGPAGGDLSGAYPNPVVAKLQQNAVKSGTLGSSQDGYVLAWVNSNHEWEAKLPGTLITLSGDVTGTVASNTISKLQGITLSISSPALNSVIQYNGTAWVPVPPPGGPPTGSAGGDLSGTYPNPQVVNITGAIVGGDDAIQVGTGLRPILMTGIDTFTIHGNGGLMLSGYSVGIGDTGGAGVSISASGGTGVEISAAAGVEIDDGLGHFIFVYQNDFTISTATIHLPTIGTATSASAGSHGDVPSQVVGYIIVNIGGTDRKIPYYAT